jgi:hypothetical protein
MNAQSDDAKACSKCGAEGDNMQRCGRCKAVYYCSRECQVGHWKEHKVKCEAEADIEKRAAIEKVKCSSMNISALRKELREKFHISTESFVEKHEFVQSLAKARVMKKLSKEITKTVFCQNCSKQAIKMHECSRCWNAHYCSKECQKSHFSEHKKNCRNTTEFREQTLAAGVEKLSDMFSSWRQKSKMYIDLLARMVMSNKQFKMQPPNFVVGLNVDFNYNYGTFLPLVGQPSIQMLDDLSAELRAIVQEALENTIREKNRAANVEDRENISHVVLVSCRGIPAVMPASMYPWCARQSKRT